MKKVLCVLIIMLLVCGCKNNKKDIIKKSNREQRTMLTCSENDVTYMFYYDDEEKPYYKAMYLEKKQFKSEEEANKYQEDFLNVWNEKYADELINLELRINDNISFINVSAIHDTKEELYKDFFGNRYNLNKNDMNKTFNNKCLIKPIKK